MDDDCNNNNRVYDGACVKHADLVGQLKAIFPNTSDAIILLTVVAHRRLQGAENVMLESVCDDLLDLRTYRKVLKRYNGSTNVGRDAAEVPGTSGRENRETRYEIDAGAIVEEGVSHPQHARAPVTAALGRPLVEDNELPDDVAAAALELAAANVIVLDYADSQERLNLVEDNDVAEQLIALAEPVDSLQDYIHKMFDEIAAPAEEERDVGGECAVVVEAQVTEAVANDAEGPDVAAAAPAAVARSPPRDPLQVNVDSVMQLFPDAQREHVEALVLAHVNHPDILTTVCNVMVETKYPKVPQVKKYKNRERDGNAQQTVQEFSNYLDESFLKQSISVTYMSEAMNLLKNEFLKVSMVDLAMLLSRCDRKYAATSVLVARVLSEREQPTWERRVVWTSEDGSWKKESSLLKGKRKPQSCVLVTDQMLINERNWLRENNSSSQSKAAMESAVAAGNDEDEDEGEAMECGCCYCEVTFERMVQCSLGHLFCEECLRRYAKEAVYGQGKVALRCMGDGCSAGFPLSQLRKALPRMLMDKYEERQVEESISLAGLADLVRCPNCDFAAILPGDSKVFLCQNVDCMMESCRHCGEDWEEHFGKRCEELERCGETRLRTHYEERMTKLKVRTCGKCSAQFFKVEGCNRMTCRCGTSMCYICRAPKISYQHFCQHAREPGKPCTSCTACSLWTNPDEDEDRAIRELKAEAQETRAAQGFVQDKEFGPPPEVTTHKKQKTA